MTGASNVQSIFVSFGPGGKIAGLRFQLSNGLRICNIIPEGAGEARMYEWCLRMRRIVPRARQQSAVPDLC